MAQQMLDERWLKQQQQQGNSSNDLSTTPLLSAVDRLKLKGRRRLSSNDNELTSNGQRSSYSLALKLKALDEAEKSGLKPAAASLQLDERVLRQWVMKADSLRQAGLTNSGSTRRLRAGANKHDEVLSFFPTFRLFLIFPSSSLSNCKLLIYLFFCFCCLIQTETSPVATTANGRSVTLLSVTTSTPPPPSATGGAALLVNGVATTTTIHPLPTSPILAADGSSIGAAAATTTSKADACVGTCSASTMTEPECLGPCEPGTAVTLEGIVWHETEGGWLKNTNNNYPLFS